MSKNPSQEHHHRHSSLALESLNSAFYIGITLNLLFVIVETVFGFFYHSLSLLSDAGHNLSDVASLILSLIALKLSKKKPTKDFTYGYKKATILASLLNALLLLFAVGFILYESIIRLLNPQPLDGEMVALVAVIGIFINGITAFLFMKHQKNDLNVKGAYLHMLADTLVSIGVVIGGVLIYYTHWFWIDPVLSIIIAIVILLGTWNLLTQSLKLSLDGVPEGIKVSEVKNEILKIQGIKEVKHLHIWALSTTENALTAQIKVDENQLFTEIEILKKEIKYVLEPLEIQHSTLEFFY